MSKIEQRFRSLLHSTKVQQAKTANLVGTTHWQCLPINREVLHAPRVATTGPVLSLALYLRRGEPHRGASGTTCVTRHMATVKEVQHTD